MKVKTVKKILFVALLLILVVPQKAHGKVSCHLAGVCFGMRHSFRSFSMDYSVSEKLWLKIHKIKYC